MGKHKLGPLDHTPGPWEHIQHGWDGSYIVGDDPRVNHKRHIADVNLYHDGSEANASLIAAAPDLLEALESLVNSHAPGANFQAVNNARKVIAKARGEHG